jgi:hypothetical protein
MMARKITTTDRPLARIRDVGSTLPCSDPAAVAEALGAEDARIPLGTERSPVAVFHLRAELASRLQTTGGRPALAGVTRRVKIPVTDPQWRELEELAASLSSEIGFAPSAGQVASVLISLSIPIAKRETQLLREELATRTSG